MGDRPVSVYEGWDYRQESPCLPLLLPLSFLCKLNACYSFLHYLLFTFHAWGSCTDTSIFAIRTKHFLLTLRVWCLPLWSHIPSLCFYFFASLGYLLNCTHFFKLLIMIYLLFEKIHTKETKPLITRQFKMICMDLKNYINGKSWSLSCYQISDQFKIVCH